MESRKKIAPARREYQNQYQSLFLVWRILEDCAKPETPLSVREIMDHLKRMGEECPAYNTVDNMLKRLYALAQSTAQRPVADLDSFPFRLECVIQEMRNGRSVYTPYDKWEARQGKQEKKLNKPRRYYLKSVLSHEEWRLFSDLVLVYPHISGEQRRRFLQVLDRLGPQHAKRPDSRYPLERVPARQFPNITLLDRAIAKKTMVEIHYGEYRLDESGTRPVLLERKQNGVYLLEPYALMWANGYYYLVGRDTERQRTQHLRVDRILQVTLLAGQTFTPPANFDPAEHRDRSPVMYPGEPRVIRLKCRERLVNNVLDFFGPQAKFRRTEKDWIEVTLNLAPSGVALFAMQYADAVEVLEPESLRRQVYNNMAKALARYNNTEVAHKD